MEKIEILENVFKEIMKRMDCDECPLKEFCKNNISRLHECETVVNKWLNSL